MHLNCRAAPSGTLTGPLAATVRTLAATVPAKRAVAGRARHHVPVSLASSLPVMSRHAIHPSNRIPARQAWRPLHGRVRAACRLPPAALHRSASSALPAPAVLDNYPTCWPAGSCLTLGHQSRWQMWWCAPPVQSSSSPMTPVSGGTTPACLSTWAMATSTAMALGSGGSRQNPPQQRRTTHPA